MSLWKSERPHLKAPTAPALPASLQLQPAEAPGINQGRVSQGLPGWQGRGGALTASSCVCGCTGEHVAPHGDPQGDLGPQ